MNQTKDKYVYLEALRCIAAFFVIFNHTKSDGFFLFSQMPVGTFEYWICMFVSVFTKFAVPTFFAISGALLLGKQNETIGKLWKGKILKLIFLLVFYAFLYYVICGIRLQEDISIIGCLKSLYSGFYVHSVHLWYLYAYISFLICLPFMRAMVQVLEDKYYYYMLVVALVLDLFPIVELVFWDSAFELEYYFRNIWIARDIFLYPCIGYFVHNKFEVKNKGKQVAGSWLCAFAGIATVCLTTHYRSLVTGILDERNSQIYHNDFGVLSMIAVFLSVKYVFEKVELPAVVNKVLISVGKSTFGIYLLHLLLKSYILQEDIIEPLVATGMNRMLATIVYCLLLMFISYIITHILLRIPIVKKFVGA